ncbi:MAG: alkaline phosphatase family protein, partial [Chloroflexi bacterium]|nr:alkaline phosphatase family protein [Chloroflexota bacterium]
PAALVRTLVLTIGEAIKEMLEARRQRALDIQPRVHRGATFAAMRAVSNVLLRDLNMTFLIHAMGRGTPILYVDFVDYDELAHHAGPERLESLRSLTGVDQALASLERAAATAPREYSIVVLSDHGQSQGATFRQRYGSSLDDLIQALMGDDATAVTPAATGEGWGPVNVLLSEIRSRPGIAGKVTSSALRGRTVDGAVDLGREAEPTTVATGAADVVVGPSGNLANVYFTAISGRATLEEIDERHPGLVPGLAAHPGIGFVLVKTATFGSVAIGRAGVHLLADDRIDGEDPLATFGPRAADHLRRIDAFAHVGDLLVNSSYDPELDEVAAFEELVGSHGGFGGPQTRPFVLAPSTLPFDEEPIVGSPAVHRQLVRWADALGVGPESGATTSATADTALPRPRAIGAVATLFAVGAVLELMLGVGALGLSFVAALDTIVPEIAGVLTVGAVLTALGIASLATAVGLWRRRRWAWLAALVLQGINVIQIVLVLAQSGLQGAVGLGLFHLVVAPLVFFYLTRPHVAAAFGRHTRARPGGH